MLFVFPFVRFEVVLEVYLEEYVPDAHAETGENGGHYHCQDIDHTVSLRAMFLCFAVAQPSFVSLNARLYL